jgi:DNA-binding XRE family transcriptional regulator
MTGPGSQVKRERHGIGLIRCHFMSAASRPVNWKETRKVSKREPLHIAVGEHMSKVRIQQNMSQMRVAKELGLHGSTVTYYESGTNAVTLAKFVRWCAVLGVQPGLTLDRVLSDIPDLLDQNRETS